jgi:hypothetical protein
VPVAHRGRALAGTVFDGRVIQEMIRLSGSTNIRTGRARHGSVQPAARRPSLAEDFFGLTDSPMILCTSRRNAEPFGVR